MDARARVTLLAGRVGPGTGTGGVVWAVARALVARGVEVDLCVRVVDAAPEGVRVRPLPRRAPDEGSVRVAFDRTPGADVVRASGGVHAAWTCLGADTPWRRLRSGFGAERRAERAEARAFTDAVRIVANAELVARQLGFWFGAGADRVRLVRTGVDLDRFRPDPAARDRARAATAARGRVAAFVGHAWRRKGLEVAVRSFQVAAGPRDQLWVGGTDAQVGPWRRRFPDPRIRWLGAIDPAAWLPGADAVLAPALYDPASNGVLEALACGVPPVVSTADGSAEIVSERRLCIADPRSVQGFADGLRFAWEDAATGARCRADAEAWPVSRMVDGLVGVIAECVDG